MIVHLRNVSNNFYLVGDQFYSLGRERERGGLHRVCFNGDLLRHRPICGLPHGPRQEAFQVCLNVSLRRVDGLLRLALPPLCRGENSIFNLPSRTKLVLSASVNFN